MAAEINRAHEAAGLAGRELVRHAIAAGQRLIEAKALVAHGEWLPWLKKNCAIPTRTAQLYMRLAKHRELIEAKSADVAHLTINAAVDLIDRKPTLSERLDDIEAACDLVDKELEDCRKARKMIADPVFFALVVHEHGGMLDAVRKLTAVVSALHDRMDLLDDERDVFVLKRAIDISERAVKTGIEVGFSCERHLGVLMKVC
nr:DUF3102 domain-containing protein [Sinorhizobium meliloti]